MKKPLFETLLEILKHMERDEGKEKLPCVYGSVNDNQLNKLSCNYSIQRNERKIERRVDMNISYRGLIRRQGET